MARGYLGKISAVISANTGDYVRKLNESAKETAAFARTVQQTLGRASSEASKSLEGIYTPIQKVERALRAAASQKLAFRGFDGAIRDVQSLQSAIAKLTDKKTIDLVVKTSGVGSLDELKRTIGVLRNQDVTIGVEGLRQQRAAIGDTGPGRIVATAAIEEAKRLDAVIEALERIDAESLKKISIQVEDSQLTAASNQFRRLTELSTQVGGPLARVQSEFSGLSGTIQAQFIPALAQAQNSYEQFQQRIKDNSDIAASEFRGLVADVKVVENAISRLRETAAAGGKLFTGEELTFVRPQAVDELNKLAAAQQKLAAAPAEVRGSSSARELLADGQVLQEQIGRISARIERLNAQGLDIKFSQAGFDLALRRLEEVRRLTEELAAGTSQGDSAEAAALARRAAAEKDFIVESQRLREQAMADMRAREEADAQRRADAEKDFIVESQRLREQAMADMRAREEADAQRRADAEKDFIVESQRLREQAMADTRAREEADAQRRLAAESEFIAESQRLREQAMADTRAREEADAQRRLAAEVEFITENQRLREQAMADTRAREEADAQRRTAAEAEFIAENQRLREQAIADTRAREEADAQRRLAAEAEFVAESQRLREQAIADTRAREEADAQRRLAAEADFIAESQRLREQAMADTQALDEADAQRRAEAASRFLRVDQQGSDIASNEGRNTPLTGSRDPRTRVLGQLGQEVGDLRNRLRGVGETLAGDIGPTVDNLTTRFQNMARAGVGVAAEQARQLAREVANVNAALDSRRSIGSRFEESFGGAGRAGLSLGVDERSLRAIGGQIEFVQGRLSALGQEVRGPVIAALDTFRTRARELFDGGAIDTTEGRAELQRLREELARTLATAGGGNERRITEQLNRVGDVARGAFGNAGLAIQQAAFAFEDFFSVTGGLDQRVRAAGNNISQLGFILGGTEGLVLGISAAIGSQLVVALINWYNEGRTTEDQTKALNDALARQKSLVEDLAKAFESLGDSISRRAFSAPAQEARQFAKELDDAAKKQRELRESRVADLDAGVQDQRGRQAALQRQLEATEDGGQRVAIQRRLALSRRREREAAEAAVARPAPTPEEVRRAVLDSVPVPTRRGGARPGAASRQREALGRELDAAGGDSAQLASILDARIRQRSDLASRDRTFGGFFTGENSRILAAREDVENLSGLLESLQLPLQEALDELSNSILRASQAASLEIESAQADVADAVRRGVPGAALLQQNLDAIADEMDAAQTRLRDAQESDSPDREQQIRLAQRDIDGIRAREDGIAEASRDIRLTSGRGGERTTAALSALQGNERFANEYGGLIARLRAAVDAEMVARLANEKAMKGGTDAEKEAARAAYESAAAVSDMAAAAAEAALAMEQAVGRIRKIGADALSQSERMADEAQQRLNERPTDENRQRRDEAEQQLIADRERVARANNALDRRRSELQESDPRLMQINAELEAINQERRRLSDEAAKNNTTVDPAEAQRLNEREAKLLAERERRLFSLTEAERRQQDAINQEISARRRLVNFMDEVERRRSPQGDPVRGLDLLDSPGQRAARELRQANADIASAVEQSIALAIREGRFGDIPGIQQRGREAQDRAREDALRQQAPGLFALADSVQNAILQGPSRAALVGTDVSTSEGQRELYRLMRGDDPSKDENLVELRKQSDALSKLVAAAEEEARARGVVLDLN